MNFIFIIADTFRFDTLECYANLRPRFRTLKREAQTPHLDRFAQSCTVFERACLGSFPTVPNRKDNFTGLMRPFNAWGKLNATDRTHAAEFVKAGYVTQMVIDTPHPVKEDFNFARDFDGWEWIRGQEGDRLSCYTMPWPIDPSKCRGGAWPQHLGNLDYLGRRFEEECFCAQTMKTAARWLERQYGRTNPFFLYVDTFDPHEPWDAPQYYADYFDPNYSGEINRYPHSGTSSIYSKAELNNLRAQYAAEVMLVDRWIGHLLETVERMGLMGNTCIVFTTDHGYTIGEHGQTGKNAKPLYEEIAHIPLMIHMPGQQKMRRCKDIVQPVDVTATLLDLAGVKTDMPMDGISLRPVLECQTMRTRSCAYSRGHAQGLLVTSKDWSLVYPPPKSQTNGPPRAEIFQLPSDPLQRKNVIRQNRKQAQALWDNHAHWWESAGLEFNPEVCPRP